MYLFVFLQVLLVNLAAITMMKKLKLPENSAAMWRVLGVVQGCVSMAIVGGVFAFNAYADALKATFNLPQTDSK